MKILSVGKKIFIVKLLAAHNSNNGIKLAVFVVAEPRFAIAFNPLFNTSFVDFNGIVDKLSHTEVDDRLALSHYAEIAGKVGLNGKLTEILSKSEAVSRVLNKGSRIGRHRGIAPGSETVIKECVGELTPVKDTLVSVKLTDKLNGLTACIAVNKLGYSLVKLFAHNLRLAVPSQSAAENYAVKSAGHGTNRAVVTPRGVKHTHNLAFAALLNHLTDILFRIADAFAELVPTAGTGANDLAKALRSELFNVFEDRIAIVAPVKHDHIIGEAFHGFGMVKNNVAPHHNGLAERLQVSKIFRVKAR
jgi:hypothetical protein